MFCTQILNSIVNNKGTALLVMAEQMATQCEKGYIIKLTLIAMPLSTGWGWISASSRSIPSSKSLINLQNKYCHS